MLTARFIYPDGRVVDITNGIDEAYAMYIAEHVSSLLEVNPLRPAVLGVRYSLQESMAVGEDHAADRDNEALS